MDGLARTFGTQMDFIKLDIDKTETLNIRQQFNLVQRSQYALVDAQGNVLQRWFGFLDEAAVRQYLSDYLAQTG